MIFNVSKSSSSFRANRYYIQSHRAGHVLLLCLLSYRTVIVVIPCTHSHQYLMNSRKL